MPEHGLVVDFTVPRLVLTALLCVCPILCKLELPKFNSTDVVIYLLGLRNMAQSLQASAIQVSRTFYSIFE